MTTGAACKASCRSSDDYQEIEIPIEKLLHFVVIPDRGGPEGLAIGEVAYKVYHMLENFEIIDGIGAERAHIGLPVFKWLAKPSPSDRADAQAMGQNLVVNEQQYVELPGHMVEFELVSITNTNADALRARINQLRWEIVGLVFGNYIRLGTTDTGNRALSETLADAFTKGVDAMLSTGVAEVLNKHLVPRLFAANPSFSLDVYPKSATKPHPPTPHVRAAIPRGYAKLALELARRGQPVAARVDGPALRGLTAQGTAQAGSP